LQDFKTLVLGHANVLHSLRVGVVFVDQFIFGLRRADFVIPGLLVFILSVHLFPGRRLRVAVIEKTLIADPRRVGKFHPLEMIGQRLLRRDIEDVVVPPIGTAFGDSICHIFSAL
jgi:hypothetical protein